MASTFPFLAGPVPYGFAHQGGGLEHPENSWPAFRHAVEDLGYGYLETDVVVSSDGVVFHMHDTSLDRTTNLSGPAKDRPWSEIGSSIVNGTNEPPPRLEDVLTRWPSLRINLEPKSDEAVEPMIALVRRLDAVDRICVGSFNGARINRLRKALGSGLCSSTGPAATVRLVAGSYLPIIVGKLIANTKAGCYQVPIKQYGIPVTTRRTIALAHAMGKQMHIWTIDEAAEMTRLFDLGVDAIMTDRPSVLREVLTARTR